MSDFGGQYWKYLHGLQVLDADWHERAQKVYALSIFHRGESTEWDLKVVEEGDNDAQHHSYVNAKACTF
jgi:hypothetical protein